MSHQHNPDAPSRLIWRIMVAWALISLIDLAASMMLLKIDRSGTVDAWAANLKGLWWFWIASASLWGALTGMWVILRRQVREAASGEGTFLRSGVFVFVVAIAVRGVVLVTHEPAVSDDVYRYLFEGRTFAAGFNPYAVRALERESAATENFRGETDLLKLMTYHELATPYLPVSQLYFGAVGLVVRDRWTDPLSSARVFRIGCVGFELILIAILFAAARSVGRSAWWVALYAWHPLPITEIAGSGHQDVLGIVLMVAALLVFSRNVQHNVRWAALLGLATVVKPVAAVAGVFILATQRDWKPWLKAMVTGGAIVFVMLAMFWIVPSSGKLGFENWSNTARTLGEKWAHFGGVYEPVLFVVRKVMPAQDKPAGYNLVQETLARRVCMLGLAITMIVLLIRTRKQSSNPIAVWRGTAAALAAIVIFTTTAHPWYLLWAFALVPLANNWPLWILSLTISWGYVVFATGKAMAGGEEWTVLPWVIGIAYVPVFAAVACSVLSRERRLGKNKTCL